MAIRRRFGSVPPLYARSKRSRSYETLATQYPVTGMSRAASIAYDSSAADYLTDRVTNASFFSNYAMEEGYDTAKKSRGRDERLLRDATSAIVSSESFATPQTSVAARRVVRGQSIIPRATSAPPRPLYPEVDYWGAPQFYDSAADTATATTTEGYYPELSFPRRPLVVYARPYLSQAADRAFMRRSPERAQSVLPVLYFREEQRRKVQAVPPFADWRRVTRAKSVPAEEPPVPRRWYMPLYERRGWPSYERRGWPSYERRGWPYYEGRGWPYYEGRGWPYYEGRGWPYYERKGWPYYERRGWPYYDKRYTRGLPAEPVPFMPLPSEGLRAHRIPRRYLTRGGVRTGFTSLWGYYDGGPGAKRRQEEEEEKRPGMGPRVLASPLARASLARAWRLLPPVASSKSDQAYYRESLYGFPVLYVPRKGRKPSGRPKAAIIASKLETDTIKQRRPRSEYAAKKYRAMNRDAQEAVYTKTPYSFGLYASNPPLPKISEGKAIRTDEGYSKPKNLLSWQYRLEAKMKPSDLMYHPSSFGRIRHQVREAQDRMDRHRQMLDRYLPEEGAESTDVAARILRKMDMEKRENISAGSSGQKETAARSKEAPY